MFCNTIVAYIPANGIIDHKITLMAMSSLLITYLLGKYQIRNHFMYKLTTALSLNQHLYFE